MQVETTKPKAPAVRSPRRTTQQDLNGALTATSWLPGRDLRVREWVDHGRRLGIIGRGVGWWIGDWLRYGNMKFGERYVRASRITGYDTQTLMNMVYVASAYDPSQRRDKLSWSHHAELAAMHPDERDRWLDLAETNRMSVRCLREEVRREQRMRTLAASSDIPATAELPAPASEHPDMRCPHCGSPIGQSRDQG